MDSSYPITPAEAASLSIVTPPGRHTVKPIKRFKMIHRRCVALHIQGLSNAEIAAALGKKPQWVSAVLNNPTTRHLLNRVYDLAEDRLRDLMPRAVEVIREGLQAPDHNTRLKTLDRYHAALKLVQEKGGESAEDVIQRVIRVRHGDVEVTVGEQHGGIRG